MRSGMLMRTININFHHVRERGTGAYASEVSSASLAICTCQNTHTGQLGPCFGERDGCGCRASTREAGLEALTTFLACTYSFEQVLDKCAVVRVNVKKCQCLGMLQA